ncbi:hypothetical protein WG906_16215 [Pedobacter sp. P351]|uniref:hypothetical protein n=1 Tax=Pedobacter superstes TaxID=3133441 RepID=UPI0030B3572F
MNIDEIKTAWKAYGTRLQLTHELSDKLIISMIKEKSHSRLTKVKRHYLIGLFYMLTLLGFGVAVLIGNPFDYTYTLEYLPIALYCICLSILIVVMINTNYKLQRVEINHNNLETSLNRIAGIFEKYQKPGRFLGITLKLILGSTILFPLSFLPRKIDRLGLWGGFAETLIPIIIAATMIYIAFKLGAFKERNGKKFEEYNQELKELRGLSEELGRDL